MGWTYRELCIVTVQPGGCDMLASCAENSALTSIIFLSLHNINVIVNLHVAQYPVYQTIRVTLARSSFLWNVHYDFWVRRRKQLATLRNYHATFYLPDCTVCMRKSFDKHTPRSTFTTCNQNGLLRTTAVYYNRYTCTQKKKTNERNATFIQPAMTSWTHEC